MPLSRMLSAQNLLEGYFALFSISSSQSPVFRKTCKSLRYFFVFWKNAGSAYGVKHIMWGMPFRRQASKDPVIEITDISMEHVKNNLVIGVFIEAVIFKLPGFSKDVTSVWKMVPYESKFFWWLWYIAYCYFIHQDWSSHILLLLSQVLYHSYG